MLLSLALAQLFNQRFPGRRVARWALIAPWAASVLMTTLIFRWALDPNSGVINVFLHDIGLLKSFGSNEADWLGRPTGGVHLDDGRGHLRVAAVHDVRTAGRIADHPDRAVRGGAGRRRDHLADISLDHASPAAAGVPRRRADQCDQRVQLVSDHLGDDAWRSGHETATTTMFMFQLKQAYIGESAAMSVINFGLVIIVVLVFLWVTRWREQVT